MPPAAGLPMLLRPGLNRRRSSACAAARPGPPAGHRTLRSGLHRPLCFTQASQLLQQLFPDRDRAPDDVVHNRDAPALPRPTERSRDVIAEIHPDQLNPPVMIQRRYPRSPLHGRTACAPGPGHPWIRGESGRRSRDLAGIMAQRSSPPAVNEPPLAGGPGPSGPVPSQANRCGERSPRRAAGCRTRLGNARRIMARIAAVSPSASALSHSAAAALAAAPASSGSSSAASSWPSSSRVVSGASVAHGAHIRHSSQVHPPRWQPCCWRSALWGRLAGCHNSRSPRCCRVTSAASWAREETPSLAKMCARYVCTAGLRCTVRTPIWGSDSPRRLAAAGEPTAPALPGGCATAAGDIAGSGGTVALRASAVMIWFSYLLGRAGNVGPPAGSTVAGGSDDHHTCAVTG